LLEKPDILLLDEPTNYLDEEHITWLKNYLQNYENAFVLISHDVDFMNDVINIVYHVNQQKIDRYVGDYHNFERLFEEKKKQLASLQMPNRLRRLNSKTSSLRKKPMLQHLVKQKPARRVGQDDLCRDHSGKGQTKF
jgi:ATPase subunit of ABC transporter with duplicated ATPase domains